MRALLIGPNQAVNDDLTKALAESAEVELTRRIDFYPNPDDLMRTIRTRRPEAVFIAVDDLKAFEVLAGAIDDNLPGLPMIGFGTESNLAELVPILMHSGVREYLVSPIGKDQLRRALVTTAAQLRKHPVAIVRLAELYAFLPAKPGVGSSTIAISTSCALTHELGVRTILLDCDLAAGTTKFLLKLGNSPSLVSALEHADNLDEDMWSQMVGKWDGLDVLHAGELDPPSTLTSASLDKVLALARAQYDTICADVASSMDPFSVQVMREARRILLVTTPELVPLHMAANRVRHLNDLGLGDKVMLLLNRKNLMRWGLPDIEVERLVGMHISYRFANDYPVVQNAILEGVPVAYRSSLGQSIMDLARSLAPQRSEHNAAPAERRKFLEFFHVPSWHDREIVWRG